MAAVTSSPPPSLHPHSEPSWQLALRRRIEDQQARDGGHARMIEQYKNLAVALKESRERNAAWLKSRDEPGVGAAQGEAPSRSYIATLERQLASLRAELSDVYRSSALTSNKQLALSDALREKDDELRGLSSNLADLQGQRERWQRKEREWEERWRMRENDVQNLHDEVLSLTLELNQVTARNQALQADNASLLQRWLDKMNERAEKMNEDFEREASQKGKGKEKEEGSPDEEGKPE